MSAEVLVDAGIAHAARDFTTNVDVAELIERATRLPLPVKLEVGVGGRLRLAAEITCSGDPAAAARAAAAALDQAQAVLEIGASRPALTAAEAELAETLGALGWSMVGGSDTQLRVNGGDGALELELSSDGFVLVRRGSSVLRCAENISREALAYFALEANARLRIARVGLERAGDVRVLATWEAVVQTGVGLERRLEEARDATAVAREATLGGLRALTGATVAEAYRSLRRPSVDAWPVSRLPGAVVSGADRHRIEQRP